MAGHPSRSVGPNWTEWREARGISLRQIADTTKIGLRYLEAIERGAFEKLPGGAYTEGYIRQYSRAVGDSANVLWESYRWTLGPVMPPEAPMRETPAWRVGEMLRGWLALAHKAIRGGAHARSRPCGA